MVHSLIKRNTPAIAMMFRTEMIPSQDGLNCYEIESKDGKIVLRGDCTISLAMAYYRYLKDYCGAFFSICGTDTMQISEATLPVDKIRMVIPQKKRLFMTGATISYSAWWWDWPEWERLIDWMAMNGINMPLCSVGSEAVWFHTLVGLGYKPAEALQFLSGPAYWANQLTGNLDSYLPLTDEEYISKRLELGKKIFNRQVELGMTPILQGFSGHVPRSALRYLKKVRLHYNPSWKNFSATYSIDPSDPYFKKVGKAFLDNQLNLIGSGHYYACNPPFRNQFSSKSERYLYNLGVAINRMLEDFDKDAVWVISGDFLNKSLIGAVPKEKLLILDISGDGHIDTDFYWGHSFVLGNRGNIAGRTTLHGDIRGLAENPYKKLSKACDNLVGTGLFPESFEQNPLYFNLASDILTAEKEMLLDDWLRNYAKRRYKSEEEGLVKALFALRDSCYSPLCTGPETGSIICARPSTELKHTAPGDTLELRYDNKDLFYAADMMLCAENTESDTLSHDICDLTRQVLSSYARTLYKDAMNAYKLKEPGNFEIASNAFLRLCEDLESLLQTREDMTLLSRLKAVSAAACTDNEKLNFEINLLNLHTLWGPVNNSVLYDNAWREWGGMVESFYGGRWRMFFELLAQNFGAFRRLSTVTKKQIDGRNTVNGSGFYKNMENFEKKWISSCAPDPVSEENTLTVARRLLNKYRRAITGE